ncbi:thrombospondin type 3 repeat-containing protein [Pseudoalteromonas sp. T1lg75]|uniref:thrombospondin type 3 repeat-containing protein n=1 Tax=Pseudoalteromonas sp. T1lg75 TaxID=2077102 RepID=UPI000CF61485|nr:thrombospondin type 3 repeat-containing protein [Pseudoalteromonas sp. T1lg75]
MKIKQVWWLFTSWMLVVAISNTAQASTAQVTHQSISLSSTPENTAYVNSDTTKVFYQAVSPNKAGFFVQSGTQWAYLTDDGSDRETTGEGIIFEGHPALLGVPSEVGTITIGAGNSIEDLWTDRIYARPVVFISLEDPNQNPGVSILPLAPTISGNQFKFFVRSVGNAPDLAGAKIHYMVAEEGWHRLADDRMLLISSADISDTIGSTNFAGLSFELGATFANAVTVAQLQRPMTIKTIAGYGVHNNHDFYQGATVVSSVGNGSKLHLRLMQDDAAEDALDGGEFGGRIGFMVLGTVTDMQNSVSLKRDTAGHVSNGIYDVIPHTFFNNFRHSAATTPLYNQIGCTADDDIENMCMYLSGPVDAHSRGTFNTPRLPYLDYNFDPLELHRSFYSTDSSHGWELGIEAAMAAPTNEQKKLNGQCGGGDCPIQGALAQMFPKFAAARGWDENFFAANDEWHWFTTHHFDTCIENALNPTCMDKQLGGNILSGTTLPWDASSFYYNDIKTTDIGKWGTYPVGDVTDYIFISSDKTTRSYKDQWESIQPPRWAAVETADYLNYKLPEDITWLRFHKWELDELYNFVENYHLADWQIQGIRLMVYGTEYMCGTCGSSGEWRSYTSYYIEVPVPEGDPGWFQPMMINLTDSSHVYWHNASYLFPGYHEWDASSFRNGLNARKKHLDKWNYDTTKFGKRFFHPKVDKVSQVLRTGDYAFANVPYGVAGSSYVWMRSATANRSDAIVIANDTLGYQATSDDADNYITMCMQYENETTCGDWLKVGQIPHATDVYIESQYSEPLVTGGLTGRYTYIAPGNSNYDLERNSQYQWQIKTNGQWQNIASQTDQFFTGVASVGTEVRFCVTPNSASNLTGEQVCSALVRFGADTDGDGVGDSNDDDIDGDNRANWEDKFPYDATEWADFDGDGIGNHADPDDDNDGLSDSDEVAAGSDPFNADSDGDGTLDGDDPRPTVYGDLPDLDNDGIADENDSDIDGDGVTDFVTVEGTVYRVDDDQYTACTSTAITVTSNADSGAGSLRQAMADVCPTGQISTVPVITFAEPMTITLSSPLIATKGMLIDGNREVTIDGAGVTNIMDVALVQGMTSSQFPVLSGVTLRNGATDNSRVGSVFNMITTNYIGLHYVQIINNDAPVIAGDDYSISIENSLIANVFGDHYAISTVDGFIGLSSFTLINSEGGAIGISGEGSANMLHSLFIAGENGSTVCDVATWTWQSHNWVENSECGVSSTGSIELADVANEDFRPVPGSVNIDAGDNGLLDGVGDFDLFGNDRIQGEYNPDADGGPLNPTVDIGAIEYTYGGDFDGDGVADSNDAFPNDDSESADSDADGVGDNSDALPNDPNETLDNDLDGIGDNADTDDDNDNYSDVVELAEGTDPFDSSSTPLDTDGDFIPNSTDDDDDNDGVIDTEDAFPLDAAESADNDLDGIGDNADTDDDNDNYSDEVEISEGTNPFDSSSTPLDTDGDFIPNSTDDDDDNDGVIDTEDEFPLDAAESSDNDLDGIGDNADTDDDNDNYSDAVEISEGTNPFDSSSTPLDTDGDFIPNSTDDDDDNDGVSDGQDAFPLNAAESSDNDLDGIGDNADTDDDNDNYSDVVELAEGTDPFDSSSVPLDTDGDFIPNSTDDDDDNDGVIDAEDAFPLNAAESADNDLDGIGDNADTDDDNDNYSDEVEISEGTNPLDSSSTPLDTDGDFIPNSTDDDDDNDGVIDTEDAFPLDAAETTDTDLDGIGNNADTDDDNDGVIDAEDAFPLDPTETSDKDNDGIGDNADDDDNGNGVPDEFEEGFRIALDVTVSQQQQTTYTVYQDGGLVQLEAAVRNLGDKYELLFDWFGSESAFASSDSVFSFDPSSLSVGMYKLNVSVVVPELDSMSASANVWIKVKKATPILDDNVDSDNDGISDADEGFGDSDGDRIPNYLDNNGVIKQLTTGETTQPIQAPAGIALQLGDIAFATGNYQAQLSMQDFIDNAGLVMDSQTSTEDSAFSSTSDIFNFIATGLADGESVNIVLPPQQAFVEDAVVRKFSAEKGWFNFVEDDNNIIWSAPGSLDGCPAPGDNAYTQGLTVGHHCLQLTIEDGGANDADGAVNGQVEDPIRMAVLTLAAPQVIAEKSNAEAENYAFGDGEKVVLSFALTSDNNDAILEQLTLNASGDMDEVNDIEGVYLYLDENQDGQAQESELLASGSYDVDNGTLTFSLVAAQALASGQTHFLVTYAF